MKRILTIAAAALLTACSSMPGAGARMGGGNPAHDMAAMGGQDAMCADHMKMMQEMQQKMSGARTAEERTAMMQEHMKAMQGGMGMMGQMKPGMAMPETGKPPMAMGMHRGMTACRMDMMDMKMTMMMQMMMDRDTMKPAPTK